MIDSAYSNTLFHELLENGSVPGLEHLQLIKREPVYGKHRFDFLVNDKKNRCYIELKSCTLFHDNTASFPDAISSRAADHVKTLAETENGRLIFLVLHSDIKCFVPNFHTDFNFYETLKKYRDKIEILAYKVCYDKNLKIQELVPVPVVIPEVKPRGIFILILCNKREFIFSKKIIKHGYYVYCGQSADNIFRTISVLKRKNGLRLILPEEFLTDMKIISDLPVITDVIPLKNVKEKLMAGGGSGLIVLKTNPDYKDNIIIYFKNNPLEQSWFWDMILEYRFGIYSG